LHRESCAEKCVYNDCSGPDCHCDGADDDGKGSNALCVTKDDAIALCDSLDDCDSVEYATDRPRAYLNSRSAEVSDLAVDTHFNLYRKCSAPPAFTTTTDVAACQTCIDQGPQHFFDISTLSCSNDGGSLVGRGTGSTYTACTLAECGTGLSPVAPDDNSADDRMLRFGPISLPAGRYKACMCDSHLLNGRECDGVEDYRVTVGDVLVSGINTLLHDSRMRKFDCQPQAGSNGLRCYQHGLPDTSASVSSATVDSTADATTSLSFTGNVNTLHDDDHNTCLTIPQRAGNKPATVDVSSGALSWWRADFPAQQEIVRVDVTTDASYKVYVTDPLATNPFDGVQVSRMLPAEAGAAISSKSTMFRAPGSSVFVLFDSSTTAAAAVCSISVYTSEPST